VLELLVPRRMVLPDLLPRSRRRSGAGARYSLRTRKLTSDEESVIRALVVTRSPCAWAAEFEVSHETIRVILWGRSQSCCGLKEYGLAVVGRLRSMRVGVVRL
jgi:hypothetical protein